MSIVLTTENAQSPAPDETASMSLALKSEAPMVRFRARRRKPKQQLTIRYEPYPGITVRPSKQHEGVQAEELEEGEILEGPIPRDTNTNPTSISPVTAARQEFVNHIQQLKTINEPCPTFCTTGTCVSICPRIHDASKITICPTVLQKQPCQRWQRGKCNLTHEWSYHIAPSCIGYLLGVCRTSPCSLAHNDFVCAFSAHCEQYKVLGYCERGAECNKIHLVELPPIIVERQHEEKARKLEEAKQKAKISCLMRKQLPTPAITPQPALRVNGRPFARRRLSGPVWSEEVEVVLGGETKGELALQQDFVPLC